MSFEPAELIQLIEEPVCAPVAGETSLLWVSNTERELFRRKTTGAFCRLAAGRGLTNKGGMMIACSCAIRGIGLVVISAWCDPYIGTYGRGAVVYGPYGGAGGFAAYHPRTGTYARGGAVYGPCGSRRKKRSRR